MVLRLVGSLRFSRPASSICACSSTSRSKWGSADHRGAIVATNGTIGGDSMF